MNPNQIVNATGTIPYIFPTNITQLTYVCDTTVADGNDTFYDQISVTQGSALRVLQNANNNANPDNQAPGYSLAKLLGLPRGLPDQSSRYFTFITDDTDFWFNVNFTVSYWSPYGTFYTETFTLAASPGSHYTTLHPVATLQDFRMVVVGEPADNPTEPLIIQYSAKGLSKILQPDCNISGWMTSLQVSVTPAITSGSLTYSGFISNSPIRVFNNPQVMQGQVPVKDYGGYMDYAATLVEFPISMDLTGATTNQIAPLPYAVGNVWIEFDTTSTVGVVNTFYITLLQDGRWGQR